MTVKIVVPTSGSLLCRVFGAGISVPSGRARRRPAFRQRTLIVDDFAMSAPGIDDCLRRADAGGTWIAAGSEPVILRRPGGPGAHAAIGGAVDCRAKYLVLELDIGTDNCSGQM